MITVGVLAATNPLEARQEGSKNTARIGHLRVSDVSINGHGTRVRVRRGKPFTVKLDYLSDSSGWCPNCQNQIVVGFARRTGKRLERLPGGKCVYSSGGRKARDDFRFRMKAPQEPGHYQLIVMATQAYNCTRALRWQARPRVIGALKVD